MRYKYMLIALALVISLFIYLFYRTERTVVTEIFIRLLTYDEYSAFKLDINGRLPLPAIVTYSLPEGLWVFCITLTSKPYYIRFRSWKIRGMYIPLIWCISLELLQLFHITNGRFDWSDILISIIFWFAAIKLTSGDVEKQPIFSNWHFDAFLCLASYGIIYLAHVIQ